MPPGWGSRPLRGLPGPEPPAGTGAANRAVAGKAGGERLALTMRIGPAGRPTEALRREWIASRWDQASPEPGRYPRKATSSASRAGGASDSSVSLPASRIVVRI